MTPLRVAEIASELIALFNQQSADLHRNGDLRDWTQVQVNEYAYRHHRIHRLTTELTRD